MFDRQASGNGRVGNYTQRVSLNYIGYRDNSNVLITI